jgi:hypothetical protein
MISFKPSAHRLVGCALAAMVIVPLAPARAERGIGFSIDKVSPGTAVPQAQMSLGMRPYANDLIFVAGIKQGFYADVGLTIVPKPYGRKVLPDQAIPLLVNKQIDAMALYPPDVIATMDSVKNIRFIGLTDLFQGFAVLGRPDEKPKTVNQFMAEGVPFAEAIKRTMAQVKGHKFATAPVVDNRIFLDTVFRLGGLDMEHDTSLIVTPDPNTLQLANGKQIDFASPTGAPFTAQLEGAGWIPLVTPLDVLTNMPATKDSPTAALVGTPGVASDADWARNNPETVLRFISVMFRIIDQEKHDPDKMLGTMLDYVNAFAGTSLDIAGLKVTINALSPLSDFAFQKNYCENTGSALYYRIAFAAAVKFNMDKGVLPKGDYNADDLIWACDIYNDLLQLKDASDKLLAKASGASLDAAKQKLVDKAKQFYAWYDYLDSYRLLRAAVQ